MKDTPVKHMAKSPDEETDLKLQALIDKELSEEEQEEIVTHIVLNPEARWRYEQLLAQKRLLQDYFTCLKQLH